MTSNSRYLEDVAIIRPILIVQLVFYHAFAIYSGAWKPIGGLPEVPIYWWLDKLSYAFMLETFVFVSGYVFGFQVRTMGEYKLNAKNLFYGKFRRLMIPSIIFSLLYNILFRDILTQSVNKTFYDVIAGTGHMWFLPMLFFCFVFIWAIEKLKLKTKLTFLILFVSYFLSFIPLPFHMGHTLHFMIFFYAGYIIQKKDVNIKRFYTQSNATLLVAAFIILFPLLTLFVKNSDVLLGTNNMIVMKLIRILLCDMSKLLYSSIGLAMLVVLVGIYVKRRNPVGVCLIGIGNLCMGVYLFQQFILKSLYDYTSLPTLIGSYWLPWVGFLIALLGSLLLTWLSHQTKLGRYLIG